MKNIIAVLCLCLSGILTAQTGATLRLNERPLTAGSTPLDIHITGAEQVLGIQFGVEWTPDQLTFDSVGNVDLPGLSEESFSLDEVADGRLSVIWFDTNLEGYTPSEDQPLFSLYFSAGPSVADTNVVSFSAAVTPPVIVYLVDGNITEEVPEQENGALFVVQPLVVITEMVNSVSCAGGADGMVQVSANGGFPPYTYQLADLENSTGLFTGLVAGAYEVSVIDSEGGESLQAFVIDEPDPLMLTTATIGEPCSNLPQGEIAASVSGGTEVYTYLWSNDADTPTIDGLAAGTYGLTVTDANGCTTQQTTELTDRQLVLDVDLMQPTCAGGANGSASLELLEPNAMVTWEDGTQGPSISTLSGGTHSVSVESVDGCIEVFTFSLADAPAIEPNVELIYGCGDGSVVAISSPTMGQAPYEYSWSTGGVGTAIGGLSAGTYTLSVMDANACGASATFVVDFVQPLEVSGIVENISCFGAQDGEIDLQITGGTPPYGFEWTNQTMTEDLDGLGPGDYGVNITAGSCAQFQSFTISEPSEIMVDPIFSAQADGTLSVSLFIEGGVSPYQTLWSTGDTGPSLSGLVPGQQLGLTIFDANGCQFETTLTAMPTSTETANALDQVQVFPNPNSGEFRAALPASLIENLQEVRMLNALGQLVNIDYQVHANALWIQMINAPAGFYSLHLRAAGEQRGIMVQIVR